MNHVHRSALFLLIKAADPRLGVGLSDHRAALPRAPSGCAKRRLPIKTAFGVVKRLISGAAAAAARRRRERLALRELSLLDDRLLRDIGVTRGQLRELTVGLKTPAEVERERAADGRLVNRAPRLAGATVTACRPDARTPAARTPDARTPAARTPDARTPEARTPAARTPAKARLGRVA